MVAGTDECPGELFMLDNKYYKRYNGSASGRYAEGSRTSEGVKGCVEARGPIKPILADIEGGLRSALSYGNAINLAEFRRNVGFIKVSNSSQTESGIRVKVLGE
jgi:IMP dehydrogenase